MDEFLKSYYKAFAYRSIDSTEFKSYFEQHFKDEQDTNITAIDWETWLNGTGMPPYRPNYDESLAKACQELAQKWVDLDANSSFDETTLRNEFQVGLQHSRGANIPTKPGECGVITFLFCRSDFRYFLTLPCLQVCPGFRSYLQNKRENSSPCFWPRRSR